MSRLATATKAIASGFLVGLCWAALVTYVGRALRAHNPEEMHDPLWWEAMVTISGTLQYVLPGIVTGYFSKSHPMITGALTGFLVAVFLNTYGGATYLAVRWLAAGGLEAWTMVLATGIACAATGACAAHVGRALRS